MRDPHASIRSAPSSALALAALLFVASAAPRIALADPAEEGRALAAELRDAEPAKEIAVRGMIRIRDGEGRRRSLPFEYRVVLVPGGWQSVYETTGGGWTSPQRLTVLHRPGQSNEYTLETVQAGGTEKVLTTFTGAEAHVPFAGSDFWLSDLALEYLHWPDHVLRDDLRITRRKGRPCRVLESRTNNPGTNGYARVLSWIDRETGKPILAEAFDANGDPFKEFEVGGVTKVDGVWELKNLEMRNVRTDSRSIFEFIYRQPE